MYGREDKNTHRFNGGQLSLDSENRNNFLFLLFAGFSKYFTTSTIYSKKISPMMNTSGFCI